MHFAKVATWGIIFLRRVKRLAWNVQTAMSTEMMKILFAPNVMLVVTFTMTLETQQHVSVALLEE